MRDAEDSVPYGVLYFTTYRNGSDDLTIVGLDIGTTTISTIVIDSDSGQVLESITVPNQAKVEGAYPFEQLQNPEAIVSIAKDMLDKVVTQYAPGSIGLTGQMHGILYVDENGHAASPLYTWQDGRGDQPYDAGVSYTQELTRRIESLPDYAQYSPLASGYGSVTHFYNTCNNLLPSSAASFCTIQCYIGMGLCGRTHPLLHASDAASLGLYDLPHARFAQEAIEVGGMDPALYPEVTDDYALMGHYKGVPVSIGLGDNQASFLGTVRDPAGSILVNVGTGQQISLLSTSWSVQAPIEARPIAKGQFLQVGAPICGGESYALLERFFSQVVLMATGQKPGRLFEQMNEAALRHLDASEKLAVSTQFRGTRQDGGVRGAISGISTDNFTPELLTLGFLEGMVDELWSMYQKMEPEQRCTTLVGSGNAVRRNPALRKVLETRFGLTLQIPIHQEEAAFGAALFGYMSAGGSHGEISQCIQYD